MFLKTLPCQGVIEETMLLENKQINSPFEKREFIEGN
jgi:hypothetical protein